jgi:peroxiredoxin
MVQDLAHRYRDRAVFIHVEIWKDYEAQQLNDAATQWLRMPNGDLTEPWLFLIGPDGKILDRWNALWSEDEVAAALQALPR